MSFSMKKDKNEKSYDIKPIVPIYKAPYQVPIPPPLPYGGMLPKLNRGYGGKILDSHVGPGGIHGNRKF